MFKSYSPTISLFGLSSMSSTLSIMSVSFFVYPMPTVYVLLLKIFGAFTSIIFILNSYFLFLFFIFLYSNEISLSPIDSVSILLSSFKVPFRFAMKSDIFASFPNSIVRFSLSVTDSLSSLLFSSISKYIHVLIPTIAISKIIAMIIITFFIFSLPIHFLYM